MFVLKVVLHEVVVCDKLADVVLHAADIDNAEVVDRLVVGPHLRDVEVEAPVIVRPVLLDVGEAVVVGVGELRLVRLEIVEPRVVVGERRRDRVGVPRVGRGRAVELAAELESVSIAVAEAVVEVPAADGRAVREVVEIHLVLSEHHVELPAVGRAVPVVVGVKWLERVLRPLVVDVDIVFVADAERGEVADDEVLVERRERLRVDGILGVDCRLRIEAELVVHLRVDESDHARRDGDDAVRRPRGGCQGNLRTAAVAVDESVGRGERIVVDLVE